MKLSITLLLTLFSIIASYGQNKNSINYFLQSELIFSASWMDEYSKTGEVQIIHQKGNYYFFYQYRRNGSLQFISDVETCFLERIRYEDYTLTGFKKEVISRIPGFRVSGSRASYDNKGENIVAAAKYKHGKLIRVRTRNKCRRISKYAK